MAVSKKQLWMIFVLMCLAAIAIYYYRSPLVQFLSSTYEIFSDRERTREFLTGLGWWAPIVFIVLQVLQVMIAPVPGEASGFIGGYLFGTVESFIFSTIALTLGSWINFLVGRFLGKRWIRRLIPPAALARMDFLLSHQGVVVVFILFVVPGFPKDFLCLFLGLSSLPIKVLVLLAAIGRMPGTLMLSAQGASLFDRDFILLGILTGVCLLMAFLVWWYREPLYRWIEKQNK